MAWHRHRSSQDQLKFTVYINEGERHQIEKWVRKYDNIETGGDLFGAWIDEHTAVVQFVLGPGVQCRRTSVSFYQDINYLRDAGGYLTQKHGLCNIGQWHSHHRLGLTRPSGGDENTVWGNMPSLGLKRYIVFIATITGGNRSYYNYSTSSYHDREDLKVNINPYLFEIKNGYRNDVPLGTIEPLPGNSPFRLDGRIQNAIIIGAESTNEIKKFPQKRQHDHVAGDERLKIPKAEAKTPGNSGDADKSGQEYAATAIYAIKEQGEQVNVRREEDEEDEKPNNNLKDRQENSQPPAKEIHKNIGEDEKHITDVHQEKKNEQQNNQKGDGVNSEQQALKAGTESEQQTNAGPIIQNDNNMFKTDGEANKTHFESNDGPTGPDTMATDDKKPGKRKDNHETALIGEESVGPKEKDEEQQSEKSDTLVEKSSDPNDENNEYSTTTRDVNPTLAGSDNLDEESTNTFSTAAEQDHDSDGIHGDEMDVDNDSHHSKNDNEPEKIKNDKTELTGEESVGLKGNDEEQPSGESDTRVEESSDPNDENNESSTTTRDTPIEDSHEEEDDSNVTQSEDTISNNENLSAKGDAVNLQGETFQNDSESIDFTKSKDAGELNGEDMKNKNQNAEMTTSERTSVNELNQTQAKIEGDLKMTLDGSENLCVQDTQHQCQNTFSTAVEQEGDSGTADIEVSEQLKAQEPPKEDNRGDIVEQREETELGLKKGSKADNAEKTIMTGQMDDKKVSSLVVAPGEDGQNEKQTEKPGNKENGKSDERFMTGVEDSSKVISKPSIPSPVSQGNGLIGIATGDSANKYTQPSTINPNTPDTQPTNEKHPNKSDNRKSCSIFDPISEKEQELESKNETSTSDTMTIADDQALTAKEVESKRMDAKDEEIDVPKMTEAASSIEGPDPECGEKSKNGDEKQDFKKSIKMESKNKDIENKKGDGDETIERIDPEEKERAINTNQNDEDVDASEQTASESQNPKKKRKLSKILKKPFERESKKKDGENKSGKNKTTERSNTEKKKRSINRSQINQDVDASELSASKPQNPKSLESKNEGIENKSDKNKTIERSDPDEKERIIIISENDQDVDASELSASESQNPKKKRKWSKIFKKPFERKSKKKDGENKSGKNETIERSDPDEKERVVKISQNDQDVDASELSASESQNPQNPFGRKSKDKKNKKAGCFPF